LPTLRRRSHCFDAFFLIQVYLGSKLCPSVLEIVDLRVPARYIRDFALVDVCFSCKNPRCASAADVVFRDVEAFGTKNVPLDHIYNAIIIIIITIKYMYVLRNVDPLLGNDRKLSSYTTAVAK
jgi:hypothetical protein